MSRYLIFIGILIIANSAFGQNNACIVKIVRLQFEENLVIKAGEITDSLLALAKPTNSIIADNSDIKKFDIRTNTACCIYPGQIVITSHCYVLAKKAISRLAKLDIPNCCGIPVAVYIDNIEIYRAMLWNIVSPFGNKSLTMSLFNDTLILKNQLPNLPDFRSDILTSKKQSANCLLKR